MKINWFGPIGPTGYGRITNLLVPALKKQEIDISVIPIYPGEMRIAEPEILKYVDLTDDNQLDADIAIKLCISNPTDILQFHGKKRIFYTMLEVDRLPPFWVKSLNTVDQVWTLSKWGAKVFKNSGIEKDKIRIVPGGVDLGIFNPFREPLISKDENFRFLAGGKWELKKGSDLLCKAFAEEFKGNEKVELVLACDTIKMFINDFNIYKELFALKLNKNRPNIKAIEGIIPNYKDMGRLYTSADCFLSPARGEGWNLPLIEAMACGLPSIVTNWSGHTEYINDKNTILLNKFKLEPVTNPKQLAIGFMQFGKWVEPDFKELKEKMRYAFDNQEEIKKIGKQAEKDVKKWTWDEAAKKAKKHLEKLI